MENQEPKTKVIDVELTEEENKAYVEWQAEGKPPLNLEAALKLYELFLNFYSLSDIYKINGKKIPLGQICDARVRFGWDDRRKNQLDSLYGNIEQKVVKVKNESLSYLTDMLSAAHKMWGDRLRIYLQEGDPAVLEDLNIGSFKNYKELITLLKDLTDKKQAPSNTPSKMVVNQFLTTPPEPKSISSGTALDLLKMVEDSKEE